jgi:hypothetical protein
MAGKYQQGKIYKITDNACTKCYIGSTTVSLYRRMAEHRKDYLRWKDSTNKRVCSISTIFDEFGLENCKIELIEHFPCENREQLRKQEGHHIRDTDCINRNVAGRTLKEWKRDHKEEQAEYNKAYRELHRDKLLQGMREWRKKNSERTRAYEREQVTCPICNATFTRSHRPAHNRTLKHKAAQQEQAENTI